MGVKPSNVNLQTEGKLLATLAAYKSGLVTEETGLDLFETFWTAFMDELQRYTRDKIVLSSPLSPE